MAKSVGSIAIDLTARTGEFTRNITNSQKRVQKFGSTSVDVSGIVRRAFAAIAGAAALRTLVRTVTEASQRLDGLAKTAAKIGATTEGLRALRHAAELTGVSSETLDMALQRMVRRISEAARGSGKAKDALIELGLSADRLAAMSPEQQFVAISEAMKRVENQGDRVRLAMRLFDSEGVALVNTMKLTKEELSEVEKRMRRYGVAMSAGQIARIEAANDKVADLKTLWEGIGNQITMRIMPGVKGFGDDIDSLLEKVGGVGRVFQWVENAVASVTEHIVYAIQQLVYLIGQIPGLGGAASTAMKPLTALRSAIDAMRIGLSVNSIQTASPLAGADPEAAMLDETPAAIEEAAAEIIDELKTQGTLTRDRLQRLEDLQTTGFFGEGPRLLQQIREAVARMPGQFQRGVAGRA